MSSSNLRATPMVGTNMKMRLTPSETVGYLRELRRLTADVSGLTIFTLLPFPALPGAAITLAGSNIAWGAQDVFPVDRGAYTGEVSAPMLADLACRYVMAGHFERRHNRGETNDLVANKAVAIQRSQMTPLICIGEFTRASIDESFEIVRQQLDALASVDLDHSVLAYEPGWAIGAAEPADSAWLVGMHSRIRQYLTDVSTAPTLIPIISGGSISVETAPGIYSLDNVDGLFVGRSALDPGAFSRLIHAIEELR